MTGCGVNLTAGKWGSRVELCGAEARYTAWTDCQECKNRGRRSCRGHPCCEEHAMLLRTTALVDSSGPDARYGDPGRPAVLLRLCTLDES